MKNKMNRFKLEILSIALLFSGCIVVLAQTVKQDLNSSAGNAKAMLQNLNFPNAINPAQDNIQNYEKYTEPRIKSEHPSTDLGNKYNRNYIGSKAGDRSKK